MVFWSISLLRHRDTFVAHMINFSWAMWRKLGHYFDLDNPVNTQYCDIVVIVVIAPAILRYKNLPAITPCVETI